MFTPFCKRASRGRPEKNQHRVGSERERTGDRHHAGESRKVCLSSASPASGNRSEAETDRPEASPARSGAKRHHRLVSLPPPQRPPLGIENCRGDRRHFERMRSWSPPGESVLRTHRTTLATHPRLDCGRRRGIQKGTARTLGPKHRHRLAGPGNRSRRRTHARPRRLLTPSGHRLEANRRNDAKSRCQKNLGTAGQEKNVQNH